MKIVDLPIDNVVPDPDNPNVERPQVFNALVEAIRETGMVEPVIVAEQPDGTHVIVSGEHRWKACKVLGFETITCVAVDWDEGTRQTNMVRMNNLKGELDPKKFVKLYQKYVDKYGEEALREKMGFTSDSQFRKLYRDTARELGLKPNPRDEERIHSLDDLALVLNSLFTRFGATLEHHFMFFTFGGRMHVMVQLDKKTFPVVQEWIDLQHAEGKDVAVALASILGNSSAAKVAR